jgi:hypothetical protein
MSRINKLRQMATKCIRKIPTVSVKSNYNVEGNLSITGKLIVNGEDFRNSKTINLFLVYQSGWQSKPQQRNLSHKRINIRYY